jgi:hypothetical protein
MARYFALVHKDAGSSYGVQFPDARVVAANISLERGMLRAIDAEAKRRKLTRSAFLAAAARREMER